MALAAIRGEKTLAELAEQFDVHPNQVWTMDIFCVPMARGFVYLAATAHGGSEGRRSLFQ